MSMFCFQCQETAKNTGCTIKGVCGKTDDTAKMQDLLVYVVKGVATLCFNARKIGIDYESVDKFVVESLFMTITNANFDTAKIVAKVREGLAIRENLKKEYLSAGGKLEGNVHDSLVWNGTTQDEFNAKSESIGVLSYQNVDARSLNQLIVYGIKGIAAYYEHALNLGYQNKDIINFIERGLAATTDDSLSVNDLIALTMETGKYGVDVMALLDKANTTTYGNPEITKVNIGVRNNPGILISGHDLKDLEELLIQTENSGVDVYTHSEMLPAHYYPAFKKFTHFVGNYGNAWYKQKEEFESFNGPILFTTNCLVPPRDDAKYIDKVYTTGAAGFTGFKHIADRANGKPKDFSMIIEQAKKCSPPIEIEKGEIVGGFAHNQVMELAGPVVEAIKSGAIKKFVVMSGCDGRMKSRDYYSEFAAKLPKDVVILTSGCAKYKYNKLNLGDIGGIPRVLDAGQCNDSYSWTVIALKLKEVFNLNDINDLPIEFNVAWYEQKAVIVLLALLHLGIKNIHLGPTLPAFLSPAVVQVLVDTFNIKPITTVDEDIKDMFGTPALAN